MPNLPAAALAAAIETNIVERCAYLGRWPRAEVHDDPDKLWVISEIQSTLFNQVARARFPAADATEAIEQTLAPYAARRLTGFWWSGPGDRPADLLAQLEKTGRPVGRIPGLAAELEAMDFDHQLPDGLEIRPVTDAGLLDIWIQVIAVAWELLPAFVPIYTEFCAHQALGADARWRLYVALLHGTPVGTSSVFLGSGSAGLYHVGVTPQARRQGTGTALTLTPLHDALGVGYRVATLFSTHMAVDLYRRLGFREYCTIGQYVFGLPDRVSTERLQRELERLGYDTGGADGIYGNRTISAVKAFQADHGLPVDGMVGPQTRRALQDALASLETGA